VPAPPSGLAANLPPPPPPAAQPVIQQTSGSEVAMGPDLLDKARRELKAGNTRLARRLAEDAFDAKYGVQKEAEALLRSIDVEEHNQQILTAHHNAEAALEAFKRRDFVMARTIIAGLDVRLLNPSLQRLVRELAANPEMQPGNVTLARNETATQDASPGAAPGKARASDMPGPGEIDSDLSSYKAMEEVIYEKVFTDSREVQNKAIALVKNGDVAQAIELLKDQLEQLNQVQVDPRKLDLLRRQIDNRIQQYKMLEARAALDKEQRIVIGGHNEGKYQNGIQRTQAEVVDLMNQYRELMKEGKYKEAQIACLKAKELDPDNLAAEAALRIATTQMRQNYHDSVRDKNEERFWKELEVDQGPPVDMDNPLAINEAISKRGRARGELAKGISFPTHNAREREIESKLTRPITVNFKDQSLGKIIEDLHGLTGINIVPDDEALREQNISLDMKMSLPVENISVKSALNLLLKKARLTYVIRDEVLQFTSENYG
jgi:tetratricopeptide (TPR) repeat protein